MVKTHPLPDYFIIMIGVLSHLLSSTAFSAWPDLLPTQLQSEDIATRLRVDPDAIKKASRDFGKLLQEPPSAVLYPSSIQDIVSLVQISYHDSSPFTIAPRGQGHSLRGQAMAPSGVVVDMKSLKTYDTTGARINITNNSDASFADVGGEQLWIDVLLAAVQHGLAPISWTDYLYLTVGGTLSNAGISGQTFRYGPQISNVYEMDVITGKGELVTCSKDINSELFFAVLGGLGQFGIITRARIALKPAPKRVKWVRMLYDDFSSFSRDQEHLILSNGLDYLEGSLIMEHSPPNNWRSSFFSPSDYPKISSLLTKNRIIYCLEVVKYYYEFTSDTVDKDLQDLLKDLSFLPGLTFTRDVTPIDFLNRVHGGELALRAKGLWDVPHPWLNLFVPKSRISDFNSGVFRDIILKTNQTTGPLLVYPMIRNKWDDRMSAVIPDEDIFYCVGLLHSSGDDDWEPLESQNREILDFCDKAGIKIKQYLSRYTTKEDWINHFGSKWKTFEDRKAQFDPKMILSPGQQIFNSL